VSSTEDRLRETLGTLAERVEVAPDAYDRAQREWRRRDRVRRWLVLALAVLVIAAADLVGLWALNNARSGSPVVFDGPPPARTAPSSEAAQARP